MSHCDVCLFEYQFEESLLESEPKQFCSPKRKFFLALTRDLVLLFGTWCVVCVFVVLFSFDLIAKHRSCVAFRAGHHSCHGQVGEPIFSFAVVASSRSRHFLGIYHVLRSHRPCWHHPFVG